MSEGMKSFWFAVAMCVVCSTLLTLGATGLKPFQEKNILLDRRENILVAAGLLDENASHSSDVVLQLYAESITPYWVDADGMAKPDGEQHPGDLPMYLCYQEGKLTAYIIPFTSRGLWGKIYGYLALDTDGATIKGFTVYKHQETPGLGGEIEKRWSERTFQGRKSSIGTEISFRWPLPREMLPMPFRKINSPTMWTASVAPPSPENFYPRG
jgi:Na+-transporting NADH:ubiquinone oxidoreductase subunit C